MYILHDHHCRGKSKTPQNTNKRSVSLYRQKVKYLSSGDEVFIDNYIQKIISCKVCAGNNHTKWYEILTEDSEQRYEFEQDQEIIVVE